MLGGHLNNRRRRTSGEGSLKLIILRKGSGWSEEPAALDCNSALKSGLPVDEGISMRLACLARRDSHVQTSSMDGPDATSQRSSMRSTRTGTHSLSKRTQHHCRRRSPASSSLNPSQVLCTRESSGAAEVNILTFANGSARLPPSSKTQSDLKNSRTRSQLAAMNCGFSSGGSMNVANVCCLPAATAQAAPCAEGGNGDETNASDKHFGWHTSGMPLRPSMADGGRFCSRPHVTRSTNSHRSAAARRWAKLTRRERKPMVCGDQR